MSFPLPSWWWSLSTYPMQHMVTALMFPLLILFCSDATPRHLRICWGQCSDFWLKEKVSREQPKVDFLYNLAVLGTVASSNGDTSSITWTTSAAANSRFGSAARGGSMKVMNEPLKPMAGQPCRNDGRWWWCVVHRLPKWTTTGTAALTALH